MRPRPLKVDFGVFVTLELALRGFSQSFLRLSVWALLCGVLSAVVCALPILLGLANYYRHGPGVWQGLVGGCAALIGLIVFVVSWAFLTTPAGGAILVDQALREDELGWADALGRSTMSVLTRAGSLGALFFVYFALVLLFVLPGLAVFYWLFLLTESQALAALFLLGEVGIGLVLILSMLGLAVPLCLLEELPVGHALTRSWQLSSQSFGTMIALSSLYVFVGLCVDLPFSLLGYHQLGSLASFTYGALFLPALLVAAYHGLAAEDAAVLGRH